MNITPTPRGLPGGSFFWGSAQRPIASPAAPAAAASAPPARPLKRAEDKYQKKMEVVEAFKKIVAAREDDESSSDSDEV
jgi:hypothetical protein